MSLGLNIEIAKPLASEVFDIGETITIKWRTAGNIGNVTISYSTDGVTYTQIVASTANDGSYDWDTTGLTASDQYRIRIQSFTVIGNSFKFELQDKSIYNLEPSESGISLVAGGLYCIKFRSTQSITNYKIELFKNSTSSYTTLEANIKSPQYLWNIPANQTIASDYKIKITEVGGSTSVESANFFAIEAQPSITVDNTVDAETGAVISEYVEKYQAKSIAWTTVGTIPNVDILLIRNNVVIETIASNLTNTSPYSWTPDESLDLGKYIIRVLAYEVPSSFRIGKHHRIYGDKPIILGVAKTLTADLATKANLSGADFTGDLTTEQDLKINAPVGESASFYMEADGGGDDGELWWIYVKGNNDIFNIANNKAGTQGIQLQIQPDASNRAQSVVMISGILQIEGEQGSTPSAPTNGKGGYLYTKADGKPYWISADVGETDLTATGGGGGGSAYWTPQWSQRYYTRYDNWFSPSTTYGASYYNWNKDNGDGVLVNWLDTYNPIIVVPKDCTLNKYALQGRPTSSQTYEFKLLKASPNWGTNGNHSLTQVGSTQSGAKTASVYEKLEETGLSVSLSAGDILIPMLRRTTTNTSSYYFWYSVFTLEATFG